MTDTPNFMVVRAAEDLPPGFLPAAIEGTWYDTTLLPEGVGKFEMGDGIAVPTGRFEIRDDGAVAEVYEVRP